MSKLKELKQLLKQPNSFYNGVDSSKRKLAIELIAGEADGEQTNRLAKVAVAIAEARGDE